LKKKKLPPAAKNVKKEGRSYGGGKIRPGRLGLKNIKGKLEKTPRPDKGENVLEKGGGDVGGGKKVLVLRHTK